MADARTSVARLLLDLTEVRPPGPSDAARLREAGVLLQQADASVRAAAAASPEGQEALAVHAEALFGGGPARVFQTVPGSNSESRPLFEPGFELLAVSRTGELALLSRASWRGWYVVLLRYLL